MSSVNTQFSIAVHLMAGIAKYEPITSAALAGSVNASPIFIKRVLSKLSKAGLVQSSVGKNGGSSLSRKPKDITLFDIYSAVEAPQVFAVHQYPPVNSCEISSNIQRVMGNVLNETQSYVTTQLKKKTLDQIIASLKRRH